MTKYHVISYITHTYSTVIDADSVEEATVLWDEEEPGTSIDFVVADRLEVYEVDEDFDLNEVDFA